VNIRHGDFHAFSAVLFDPLTKIVKAVLSFGLANLHHARPREAKIFKLSNDEAFLDGKKF
jgi:hypothetical protein